MFFARLLDSSDSHGNDKRDVVQYCSFQEIAGTLETALNLSKTDNPQLPAGHYPIRRLA